MCVMMLSFVACHEDQAEEESSPGREEVRVAVVLPLEDKWPDTGNIVWSGPCKILKRHSEE